MNIAVIGTGYVGLVSGACLAEVGHRVVCVDTDANKIERLRAGVMPIYEPGLEELVRRNVGVGRLSFATDYAAAVPEADIVSLAVGTPSAADGSVDMKYVFAAVKEVARHLTRYAVIANKSTVPVGTAEQVSRLIADIYTGEFDVVSNPEFLREGHAVQDFLHPARIVIGSASPRATEVMQRLYALVEAPVLNMGLRSAELTKYAANTFLATKISFINEIAQLAERIGADVADVARGIGTDPRIGKDFLRAGLGWGGSCFPKDVRALRHLAQAHDLAMPIASAACEINSRAKERIIERVEQALGALPGQTIALLGLAFKNDTDDTRESAAIELAKLFHERGAIIQAYDPAAVIHDDELNARIKRCSDPYQALAQAQALVIATEWDEFRVLDFDRVRREMRGDLVMDARNMLSSSAVRRAGLRYLGVGRS